MDITTIHDYWTTMTPLYWQGRKVYVWGITGDRVQIADRPSINSRFPILEEAVRPDELT